MEPDQNKPGTNQVYLKWVGVLFLLASMHSQGLAIHHDDLVIRLEGRMFDQLRMLIMADPQATVNATNLFDYDKRVTPSRFRFVGVTIEQGPHKLFR